MTRRQESMLALLGSAVIAKLITELFSKYDSKGLKELEEIMISSLGTIATLLLIIFIAVAQIKPKIDDQFVNPSSYPVEAAEYIKQNLDVNSIRLYNEYNYGSYLLFQGIPVFIDSRADLYAPEFNPGVEVFNDYINLSNVDIDNVEEKLDKYGITNMLMYKKSKLRKFVEQNTEKYNLLYEDDNFCLFERKQVKESV